MSNNIPRFRTDDSNLRRDLELVYSDLLRELSLKLEWIPLVLNSPVLSVSDPAGGWIYMFLSSTPAYAIDTNFCYLKGVLRNVTNSSQTLFSIPTDGNIVPLSKQYFFPIRIIKGFTVQAPASLFVTSSTNTSTFTLYSTEAMDVGDLISLDGVQIPLDGS